MGAGNWLIMSGILFILLQHRIEFSAVVSVLLLAAVAGVITHIPPAWACWRRCLSPCSRT
jgi:hypothetical protein